MAIQKTYTVTHLNKELVFVDAYIRIETMSGNKNSLTIMVYVRENVNDKKPIDVIIYDFIPSVKNDAPNFYIQGYEHLKLKPEFEGAIDILEPEQITS